MLQWIRYADGFPTDPQACFEVLKGLNDTLADVSVLLGNGFTPSEADVIVFAVVHSSVVWIVVVHFQLLNYLYIYAHACMLCVMDQYCFAFSKIFEWFICRLAFQIQIGKSCRIY